VSWTITRDHISAEHEKSRRDYGEEHTRIPVVAAAIGIESEPLPAGPDRIPFRLYDDDGELYYEGVLDDDDECLNQEAALAFGMTDAGCTTIKVLRAGEWVQEIS
jgi:hypothetical protein